MDDRNEKPDKIENLDEMSKKAVGSLFDESPRNMPAPNPPPYRFGDGVSDAAHEEYIERATHTARAEREKIEAERGRKVQDPIMKRAGDADAPRRPGKNLTRIPADRRGLTPRPVEAAANPFDMRIVALVGIVIVLIIFVFMATRINARGRQLAQAEAQIEYLTADNAYLVGQISQLEYQRDNPIIANPTEPPATTPTTPPDTPPTTPPPQLHPDLTLDAQGNRIYTVLLGDSLWGIASRFLGDGARHNDIRTANNLAADHVIVPGDRLIIPD